MSKRKPPLKKWEIGSGLKEPIKQNMRSFVLETADKAVNGSHDVSYGAPESNFGRISLLWNTYLATRVLDYPSPKPLLQLTQADVAIFNILLKVGRLAGNQSHIDSWVDIAGYAACGAEVVSKP